MANTFTFIARSASDPARAAVFTIRDHRLALSPSPPLDYAFRKIYLEEEEFLEEPDGLTWVGGLSSRLLEMVEAFDLTDVDATAKGSTLRVRLWVRVGGLRLTPVVLLWNDVDNPEAARGFVRELGLRKAALPRPHQVTAPLNYWVGWLAAAGLVFGLAMRVLGRRRWSR